MSMESPFRKSPDDRPVFAGGPRTDVPDAFGSVAQDYRAATEAAALFDRSDRGTIVATGKDRKSWLHNLVSNAVKTLDDFAGVYAFAVDVRGRVQFDLNILSLPDELRLDLGRLEVDAALKHLDKFLITEDVKLADASHRWARLGCCGPQAAGVAASLGATHFSAMGALSSFPVEGGGLLVRHDFAGLPGFELFVPMESAATCWDRLGALDGVRPAGAAALDVLRIEARIPWLRRDIDDKTIPPETGQIERGISYHKGCYLGQEVMERMRSHGSLARRLVSVQTAAGPAAGDPADWALPVALMKDGKDVGKITSLVRHPLSGAWIGLGYLKTLVKETSGVTAGDPPMEVLVR